MSNTKTEAQRLADELDSRNPWDKPLDRGTVNSAADELRRLHAELEQARAALAAQGEPVGEVFTMEALGTPGKPFCHVLLNRPLPTGTKLYTAPPAPAKPMTDAWADGVQDAADLLKRMADEMAMERGEADPDTGAIQFKSAATREWHASLGELAEEIERLKPANPTITDKGCA